MHSDALLVAGLDFGLRRQRAEWIPLEAERRAVQRFPRGVAHLNLTSDGHAVWVEDNQLWRAPFDAATGLRTSPLRLSDEAAVEARYARDGTILFLSPQGLRLRSANGSVRTVSWPLQYRVRAAPERVLIRGPRVIDGRGTLLTEPRDVLLEGGRIARIGPAGTVPNAGARVIDARDAYLLPGFIDLHAHIWDDLTLAAWLHNGVTTIRDIASQKLKTPDTRNAIEAGIVEGPRVVYGGAMFHGMEVGYSTLADQMPNDSGSIARAVAILAGMDARYVKERGFSGWWRAVHLVNEAHRFGMVVSGHCEHILPVIAAGVDGVEHVLDCFRDRFTVREDLAELARHAGLWIVPTAALRFSMLRGMEDADLVKAPDIAPFLVPAYRPFYAADSANRRNATAYTTTVQRLERSVRRYNDAGVALATGSDSPFPLGVADEMEVLVRSGLTPMQAIVAATGGAARALNAPMIGTIAEGQWADLVLLSENPLDDIRNTRRVREVFQGGWLIDRAGLRRRGLP